MNEILTKFKTQRFVLVISLLTYLALFFYAGYFFKERTIFLDAAFHLFSIVKDGDFAIQANRFGAVFTQMFPLVILKLNLSLTQIAFWYSEGFVLLNFVYFLIIFFGFRNSRMAFAHVLFHVIMTTESFYWIQCEIIQGIGFCFVFLSYLEYIFNKDRLAFHSLLFLPVLLFFMIFFYPLMPFVVVFGLLFGALSNPANSKKYIWTTSSFILLFYLKLKFFKNYYDTEAMQRIDNFFALFPNYINTKSFTDYIHYYTTDYYFVPLALCSLVVFYFYQKQFLKMALLLVFYGGFSFLLIGTYPNGADKFYLEPQYSILSFFIVLPLAYDLLPALKKQIASGIIIFIISASLLRIFVSHSSYTERLHWLRTVLKETKSNQQKLIIPSEKVPMKTILMSWGSSYEFWLLSTMETGSSRSIIIEEAPGEFDYQISNNKAMITKWGAFNYRDLNSKYFIFSDTSYYRKY